MHTRANAQAHIAAIIAAQLADGRDLKLLREDDAEYRLRQEKELAAKDRERLYIQREKVRKTRLALARGISFMYPRRGDAFTARAVARARTFAARTLRSLGRPDQKKHAERSKHWRNEVRQRSEVSGLPWVRKRQNCGHISHRAAKVAKFMLDSKFSNDPPEPAMPAQPENIDGVEMKKRQAARTARERKDMWNMKQVPKERKAPRTARERKDAWKLKKQSQESQSTTSVKKGKDKKKK